jgi:hypothetical protein
VHPGRLWGSNTLTRWLSCGSARTTAPAATHWPVMAWSLLDMPTRRVIELAIRRLRGNAAQDLELLVLQPQVAVRHRQMRRLVLEPADRVLWTALSGLLPRIRQDAFSRTPKALSSLPRVLHVTTR